MDLNFNIENQSLVLKLDKKLVNKSNDYLRLLFNFNTDDWANKTPYCILRDNKRKNYLFQITSDGVYVPGCILHGREFHVTAYGVNSDGVRITTNILKIRLGESGFTEDISCVSSSVDVVQDLYVLIQELDATISPVGKSGSYNDLNDIPTTFTPEVHNHSSSEIIDFDEKTGIEIKRSYRQLANAIRNY